jgi:hypothetical protein
MGPAQKTAVNGQAVEPINKWFTRKEGK